MGISSWEQVGPRGVRAAPGRPACGAASPPARRPGPSRPSGASTGCWLAERLAPADPTDEVDSPRAARQLPGLLSRDEVDRLLLGPDPRTAAGRRDRAMLELLYATGLRVSELVSLQLNDVDLEARVLVARGKGNKERLVPVGAPAAEAVKAYLATARERLLKGRRSQDLFVTPRGRRLTRQGFAKLLGRYARGGRHPPRHLAAQAAPLLRHPPAGGRGRPARRPGHAGARRRHHHPDLHPRRSRPT